MLALATGCICGMGITEIVNVSVGPLHPLEKPATCMLALIATELILSTTNGVIEPTPVTPRPILVLLLNQVICAPATLEVKFISGVVVP